MKKLIVFSLIIVILSTGILTAMTLQPANYLKVPKYTHSFTKALCTDTNFCQDYEIFCRNSEMISISPITGAVIQFSETWQDPRNQKQRNNLC